MTPRPPAGVRTPDAAIHCAFPGCLNPPPPNGRFCCSRHRSAAWSRRREDALARLFAAVAELQAAAGQVAELHRKDEP